MLQVLLRQLKYPDFQQLLALKVVTFGVNRQERLQPRNENAREVYLGPRAGLGMGYGYSVFASNCISRLESFLPIDPAFIFLGHVPKVGLQVSDSH